jgi:AraC-like DNA-binding protein
MSLARHYLDDTTLSVQEVAYLLDYAQPAPFSRAFKTYFGVSPEASRRDSRAR